jgi:Trypsin
MRWCLVVLVAGCGAAGPGPGTTRAAITNGAADSGDPAVAAVLDATGAVACSGALIAPHVVLTAAHCGIDASTFDQFRVAFGAAATTDGAITITDARPDPSFDPSSFARDLALLVLERPGPAAPLALDARAVDASLVGATFSVVGFGATSSGASDDGTKRIGTAGVTAVGANDFTATAAPSQPCVGDSGGPALFANGPAPVLTGVVSHGDPGCSDHAVFARVDVAASDFLEPGLAALASSGAANVGDRCFFDEQCASGRCLQAADDPKRWFCSRACSSGGDCPPRMECGPAGCRWPAPSPGALGAKCAQPADCASTTCYQAACTRTCIASDCPSGFACTNTTGITFYCLAVPRGGCSLAGRGAPLEFLVVLAPLALLLSARRRSRARGLRARAARRTRR